MADAKEIFRFPDLERELRDYIYELAFTTDERVDLLRVGRIDMRILWVMRQIRHEASIIYNEEQQRRASEAWWRDTAFYVQAGLAINGMNTLFHNHNNNNYLSWITTLEISAPNARPIFRCEHGVWYCVGPCCTSPHLYQNRNTASLPHPQSIIILPRGGLFNQNRLDGTLVTGRYFAGPPLHSWTNMPNLGPSHDTLIVAQLLPSVTVDANTASLATGGLWTGLSVFQITAMWGWFRQADSSLGPRS